MPSIPWVPLVRQVADGQPIAARYTNSAVKDLIQRTDYLYNKSNAVEASKLVLSNVNSYSDLTIAVGLTDYNVVAIDIISDTLTLIKASASPTTNQLFAIGILVNNAVLAFGPLNIPASGSTVSGYQDLLLVPGEDWTPGTYFLSQSYPGKISVNPIATDARVRVGYYLGDGVFLVDIAVLSEFYQHKHITQVLSVTDTSQPIFIPVSPAPFGSEATLLFVNGSLAKYGIDYEIVTVGGIPGIRWLWVDANIDPLNPDFNVRAYLLTSSDELLITYMIPVGTQLGVSTLTAGNSNILVTDCAGNPATKGDLKVKSLTRFNTTDNTRSGPLIVKSLDYDPTDDGGKVQVHSGYVVEKLTAGPGIVLDQLDTTLFPAPTGQGRIRVSANSAGQYDELNAIALRGAKEGVSGLYPFVSLPKASVSSFISKKRTLSALDPTKPVHILIDYALSVAANSASVLLEISYVFTPDYNPANAATPILSLSPTVSQIEIQLGNSITHLPDRPSRLDILTIPTTKLFANSFLGIQIKRLSTNVLDTYTGAFNILQLGYTINN